MLFHGCPKCYSPETYNTTKNMLMCTIYKYHLNRINYLNFKFPTIKIEQFWECDINNLLKNDEIFKQFAKNVDFKTPINPRDALFGGRTNAIKLYHKCLDDEEIHYVDFTSLYPWAQKYCKYPLGHPEIITENFEDFDKYFGIVKCTILAPTYLHLPVLPVKLNGKLVFALCSQCALEQSIDCVHSIEERSIEGTWVTEEVNKAIEKGYKILKIYEIWHFKDSDVYDKDTKTGGLFTSYIDLFLKGKQVVILHLIRKTITSWNILIKKVLC